MNEKIETMMAEIQSVLVNHLSDIAANDDTIATKALKEIQDVVKRGNIVDGDMTDFEIVEEIVCIFEKYEIDAGGCHDF